MAGAALDTITNLCMVLAMCSARISAWTTLLQRQVWLRLSSSIPEDVKKDLLEGPISSKGLFGTHYKTVFERLHSSSEALEEVRKHAVSSRPDPRPDRVPVRPREQARAFRSQQRWSSPLAAYAVMQPPATQRRPPQLFQRARTSRGQACHQPPWSDQNQDMRRAQHRK